MQDSFLSLQTNKRLERVNDRHFGILESSATLYTKMLPKLERFFFFIVKSIVYDAYKVATHV